MTSSRWLLLLAPGTLLVVAGVWLLVSGRRRSRDGSAGEVPEPRP